MKRATVAIEDKRFYKHGGVDYVGIVRAAFKNLTSDEAQQGGSTLTMQLVRNLYTPENRFKKTLMRKIREAKLAEELEREHSKEWVLDRVPQQRPVRDRRRADGGRRAGGRAHLLRQARLAADAARRRRCSPACRRRRRSTTRSTTPQARASAAARC